MKPLNRLVLAVAALALAGTTAQAAPRKLVIEMVTHGQATDPFWSIEKNGADLAAKQMGVEVQYRAPNTFNMVRMADLIRAAADQKPAGLIVTVPDYAALKGPIKQAEAQGIPVIVINTGGTYVQKLHALMYIGEGNYEAGVAAGKRLAAMGAKDGVCIDHEVGNVSLDHRCAGFKVGFGHKVTILPTTEDPSTTESRIEALLRRDPKVDALLGLSAQLGGVPAVEAVAKLGLKRKIFIGSFDLSAEYLKDVQEGKADFAMDQQPFLQAYLAVVLMANDARYGIIPATTDLETGPNFITKNKAGQVIALAQKGIR